MAAADEERRLMAGPAVELNTAEPPPVANDRIPVWDLVVADMQEREIFGGPLLASQAFPRVYLFIVQKFSHRRHHCGSGRGCYLSASNHDSLFPLESIGAIWLPLESSFYDRSNFGCLWTQWKSLSPLFIRICLFHTGHHGHQNHF